MAKGTATTFGISPAHAAKVTEANIRRTIKQCEAEGKPLPPTVAKIVAQLALGIETPSSRDYVKNKSALAAAIGISRPTLYELLKHPGRPPDGQGQSKYNVTAWKLFAQQVSPRKQIEGVPLSAKEQAQIERDAIGTKKIAFQLGVLTRDYVTRREVNEHLDTANAIVNRELRKAFEHVLPPQLEGLTAHEIQRECRRVLDEVLAQLPKHLEGTLPEA